jgi:hypothetical protein
MQFDHPKPIESAETLRDRLGISVVGQVCILGLDHTLTHTNPKREF